LSLAKAVGHTRRCVGRRVDHDRQQEGLVIGHVHHPMHREIPLAPEVALATCFGVGGDERNEQRAFPDLLADRGVPRVAAAKFALVEPDLDAGTAQRVADAPCGVDVLRCIAQENGLVGITHAGSIQKSGL